MNWIPRRLRKLDGHAITCRQVVALVTDYLDANLTRSERALFEAHVALFSKYTDDDIHNLMAYIQTMR